MEDPRLLQTEPGRAPAVVAEWRRLGVEAVRLHARWYAVAPEAKEVRRPRGFRPADPGGYAWGSLDPAVDLVRAAGMTPMLTVTGPAPFWGTADPRRREGELRPRPAAFGAFARAVARRYGDRVDRYLIWNEPNQPGWLLPQRTCRGRGARKTCAPASPHLYRALFAAAARAIRAADPGATILFGELAPVGADPTLSTWRALAPLPFLRALGCVDDRFRPLRGGPCRGFRPLRADALGYHPHGKKRPPDVPNPDPTEAQIGDLGRLFGTLDRLTRLRRLRAPAATSGRFDVHMTEFGFQTDPPDRTAGVSLARQARYLQQAAYVLWRRPRVRSLVHYQWEDEQASRPSPKAGFGGWQSGLRFFDGRPKPALAAFAAPLVYDRRRSLLWGQLRAGPRQPVVLQKRAAGAATWEPVARIPVDSRGFWSSHRPLDPRAAYRFAWTEPPALLGAAAVTRTSGVLTVAGGGRLPASRGAGA